MRSHVRARGLSSQCNFFRNSLYIQHSTQCIHIKNEKGKKRILAWGCLNHVWNHHRLIRRTKLPRPTKFQLTKLTQSWSTFEEYICTSSANALKTRNQYWIELVSTGTWMNALVLGCWPEAIVVLPDQESACVRCDKYLDWCLERVFLDTQVLKIVTQSRYLKFFYMNIECYLNRDFCAKSPKVPSTCLHPWIYVISEHYQTCHEKRDWCGTLTSRLCLVYAALMNICPTSVEAEVSFSCCGCSDQEKN